METASDERNRHQKAMALILCLFIGFLYVETVWKPYFYQTPRGAQPAAAPQQQPAAREQPAPSPQQFAEPAATPGAAPAVAAGAYPSDAQVREAGIVNISTTTINAELSLLGGRFLRLDLIHYPADTERNEERVNMVRHVEHAPYPLAVISGGVNDAATLYTVASETGRTIDAKLQPAELVLRGTLPDGREITKQLRFHPDGYAIDLQVTLSAAAPDSSRVAVEWTQYTDKHDTSLLDPYNVPGFVWYDGQRATRQTFKDFTKELQALPQIHWVAMANNYFVAGLLATGETPVSGTLLRSGDLFRVRYSGDESSAALRIVAGPKRYEYLESLGKEFELTIDFGKLGIISAPLLSLLHLLYSMFGNYGLAIVVLTILVKMVLFPLNSASFRQMKAMQDLKPEIDRIRKEITDTQQQQLELMALYKKRGVNPLGGCLPILLQMPIFIGLYSALMLAVELRGASFALWITDLSGPEKLMIGGFAVPVMVILFVLSMMVQQWTTPTSIDPTQKKVMMVMPLIMGFMFASFPAGLTLYWLTNNLISIGQQKALYRYEANGKSAFWITSAVSAAVFLLAYVVTLL